MSRRRPFDASALLAQLEASLADAKLDDDEKRLLVAAVRDAAPPEDGLRQLRNRAFELARAHVTSTRTDADDEGVEVLRWLEGVVRSLDVARAPVGTWRNTVAFSPGLDCLDLIVGHVRGARRSLDVCVFAISDDRITHELLAAHARGVRLRLLTDNEKEHDAGSDIDRLRAAGIATVVDRTRAHMHHKFAIVDATWLLNGSYNWTRSAGEVNEENLVAANDPALVASFQRQFDALWLGLGGR